MASKADQHEPQPPATHQRPAAADKVHNLQPVPLRQAGIGPLGAGNDVAVMLDGYPVAFETEVGNQVLEVGPGRQLRKFTRLAVEDEMHRGRLSPPLSGSAIGDTQEPTASCV